MRFVALDTEHGGFGEQRTLLSLYMAALDDQFNVLGELDLKIKPNNGVYHVQAQAMSVNKIDLVKHDKEATSESQAGQLVREFLKKHSDDGADKLIPIGQNVAGDIEIIAEEILKKDNFKDFVSYRVLDTGAIAAFFRLPALRLIPIEVNGGLESLLDYYGVEQDKSTLHTAKGDTWAAIKVLKKQIKVILKLMNPNAFVKT